MYCSDRCLKDALNARLREKRARNKQDVYTKTCQCCGKIFSAKANQTRYCSDDCKRENRVKKGTKSAMRQEEQQKVIVEADIYSTWLANYQQLKPNDMLTRKAMLAKALGTTYGQIQGADDKELKCLEKKAIKAMQKGAVACTRKRKK